MVHFLDKKFKFEGFPLTFSTGKEKLNILGNLELLKISLVFYKSCLASRK